MGLDTTHDAFHGPYSAFNRFRQVVAKAAGGSYPPHDTPLVIGGENIEKPDHEMFYVPNWEMMQKEKPGLAAFLNSNDCEGDFPPELCANIAADMEELLPEIDRLSPEFHGVHGAPMSDVARQYIAGCRAASAANETLKYRWPLNPQQERISDGRHPRRHPRRHHEDGGSDDRRNFHLLLHRRAWEHDVGSS